MLYLVITRVFCSKIRTKQGNKEILSSLLPFFSSLISKYFFHSLDGIRSHLHGYGSIYLCCLNTFMTQ